MERWRSLADAQAAAWSLLVQATVKRNDPLRVFTLGVAGPAGRPHLRSVVLRQVQVAAGRVVFFTDFRSAKVPLLQAGGSATAHFYHPARKVQMVLEGNVQLHHLDEVARVHWRQLSVRGRRAYATVQPPGTSQATDATGLPPAWDDAQPLETTEELVANFLVVVLQGQTLELLHLHDEGHQRARFVVPTGVGEWLVP